jgi:aspartate/methionine/tyrosine aminotransferase
MKAAPFCEALLRETGVMVFPGDMFGEPDSDFIRISYLQPLDRIKEAMGRMQSFIARQGVAA